MTNIKRQPIKNGLLLVLIFILGTVLSAAISVRSAIIATEESVMMRVPAVATIHLNSVAASQYHGIPTSDARIWRENRPTAEDISAVGQLPLVRAYDFYFGGGLSSWDLNWAVMQVDESRTQGLSREDIELSINGWANSFLGYRNLFPIKGVSNPDITDIESGLLSLASGRTFTADEIESGALVAIVSQAFADENNLFPGATMTLDSIVQDYLLWRSVEDADWDDERFILLHETYEVEIVGTFVVEREPDYENLRGWELSSQIGTLAILHNRIYMPVTTAEVINSKYSVGTLALNERNRERSPASEDWLFDDLAVQFAEEPLLALFLLFDPRNLDEFSEKASELLPDFWEIRGVSGAYYDIISSMDTILEIADLVLLLAAGATIITLTLTITLLLRDRRQEIGIYMTLGDKKSNILTQFLTEIFLVAAVGIALALFTGNVLSSNISRNMLEHTLIERMVEQEQSPFELIPWDLMLFNPAEMSPEEVMEMYDISLGLESISIFVGVSVTVILISTIAPIVQIVKLEPKKVLM